ncbi:MAG TPA: D-alanine--D-alanine ligase family protein [Polyangia bacterium]|nr:D-alanine--D-alanine ligase family protein [Polyangia bacterium]
MTRVVILFGGRSAEHEVSILSARNIWLALDRTRFLPALISIDKQGRWRHEPDATLARAVGDPTKLALDPTAPPVAWAEAAGPDDIVFPIMHGTTGEDGVVQGLLEFLDVGYVGAGVLGSAIGMDKDVSKRLLREAGLPVVDFRTFTATEVGAAPASVTAAAQALGYPLFVKPANTGSSVGVARVPTADALMPAVRGALAFDRKVILEAAVDAREIECAVLGNDDPQASVPGEIIVGGRHVFYSYDAKYVDPDGATLRIPADVAPDVRERVRALSIRTFQVLDLAGMARVDFFLDRKTGNLFVNEVNTIPGFTAMSMYPKMWEAAGMSQTQLVSRLVELGIQRRDARRALARTGPAGR